MHRGVARLCGSACVSNRLVLAGISSEMGVPLQMPLQLSDKVVILSDRG
jgi:hypothetical protein